jgi:Mg2+ and Co2+ transporter CorA
VVSTVLLPVTVILGFFGVSNLNTVPSLAQPADFAAKVASCVVVSVGILAVFRGKGWL